MSYNIAVKDTQLKTLKSSLNIVDKAISSGSALVIGQKEYEEGRRPKICIIQKDSPSSYRGFMQIHTQTYLEEHFSYPRLNESMKCDKVEFTVDVSAQELLQIISIFKAQVKIKKCMSHCNFDDPYKTKFYSAYTITIGESSLLVFYNPVNRNNAKMKISYNPDKVNKQHLDNLIKIIVFVTKNRFNELINKARVTRVDFAIDFIGVHISDLLFNKTRTEYYRVYLTSDNIIEAIVIGADGYNRVTAYDKLAEQVYRAIGSDNNALAYNLLGRQPWTRLEPSMRPYKMTCLKNLYFSDYEKLHDCFKDVKLYDETAILNNFCLKRHFTDFKLKGINYVLGNLNREQRRMLRQQLTLVQIEINHKHIKLQQDILLGEVLNRLLSTGRKYLHSLG
jgi:hypothetical protein